MQARHSVARILAKPLLPRKRRITGSRAPRKGSEGEKMSTAPQAATLDMNKLNAFIGQFVNDLGASVHAGMVVIGEKLGLYKALAARPMGSSELAL